MPKCQCGEVDVLNDLSTVAVGNKVHSAMDPCHELELTDTTEEPFDPDKSNLVQHARREIDLIGLPEKDRKLLLDMVERFAQYGHSGGSAQWFTVTLTRLLQFENLMSLTDNPNEWERVAEDTWQSVRNSEAFSLDGGKTYYLLSENEGEVNGHQITHTSKDHRKKG